MDHDYALSTERGAAVDRVEAADGETGRCMVKEDYPS
jgi:hypothetical protein